MNRDIIWITLESIRADHLSIYGHTRETTPELQSLVDSGVVTSFPLCFAHGIWTRASSASILTGRAISDHRAGFDRDQLPKSVSTIPEQFSENGYRTVGVSNNTQVSGATNLDRGFEEFYHLTRDTLLETVPYSTIAKYLWNIRNHSVGFSSNTRAACTTYIQRDLAKRELKNQQSSDSPLFLYMHLNDSHHPYWPPVKWRDAFVSDLPVSMENALSLAIDMSENLHERIGEGADYSDEEFRTLEVLYDMVIRYVDHMVADLITEARQRLDDPIVIVTGDHGELFGEDNLISHTLTINDAVTHVPFISAGIDGSESVSDQIIQPADALQMVANEINAEITVPAGQDPRKNIRSYAISEVGEGHLGDALDLIRGHNPEYQLPSLPLADVRYYRSDEAKYRYADIEHSGVDDVPPEVAGEITDWIADHETERDGRDESFDEETMERLKDLGYA